MMPAFTVELDLERWVHICMAYRRSPAKRRSAPGLPAESTRFKRFAVREFGTRRFGFALGAPVERQHQSSRGC
jgi:hypothetical protein